MERNAAKDFQEHLVLSRVAWLGNIMWRISMNIEWYEWVIPLVTLVFGVIIQYLGAYYNCKEMCKHWHLDFKKEWKKVKWLKRNN